MILTLMEYKKKTIVESGKDRWSSCRGDSGQLVL